MDYAQQLADFAHILEQKRLVTALEGNASVIDRQTGLTYVTPSGRIHLELAGRILRNLEIGRAHV